MRTQFTFTTMDLIGLVSLFIFVLTALTIAEVLRRKEIVGGSTSRKIVHLSVGNVVLVFPFFFSNVWTALIGPIFFIPFTYFTSPASPIKKFRLKGVGEGHKYGTVYYAISLTVLVGLFFYPDITNQSNVILFASFIPLVWGDGMSAVIGTKFGEKSSYTIYGSTKSLLGSWTAAFATLGAVTVSCLILNQSMRVAIYIGLLTGFITAIIEAITPKGFDNIAIPATNAIVLFILYTYVLQADFENLNYVLSINSIISAGVIGLLLAILGITFKALTWDGAIAGFYFGFIILGLGSWTWGAMYVSFFFIGTLFTFVGKEKKKAATEEFEKGNTARDSVQAMVNSIVPSVLAFIAILVREPILTIMAGGALATSLSDTLGTEIGTLSKRKPRLSTKPWKKVDAGTPGAISLLGLFASIVAAAVIAGIGFGVSYLDTYVVMHSSKLLFLIAVIIGGFLGSYADSIFACTIQKMNRCQKCNRITEKSTHCDEKTIFHSGIEWMQNDVVNLFSVAIGAFFSAIVYIIGYSII
ncbi:MAG: DUF92 domain-containing protein [Candidatus Heimdallarchaeota archaeon]|nr:DUF92 domain-containing protein [Candidatus Heimdallarchaeota archaeon]